MKNKILIVITIFSLLSLIVFPGVSYAATPEPSTPENLRMKLEINPNGKVNMRGFLQLISGNIMTVKVFGIVFTVNTGGADFDGRIKDLSLYKVGDYVRVKGNIDFDATTPTIKALSVKDTSIRIFKGKDNNKDEGKSENSKGKNKGRGHNSR
ncbi:hypothetical protein HY061_00295 [Candidatus Azambacteria bacterium]|nr:hypothetical protein [Candidatus Azambacteria bacterium]